MYSNYTASAKRDHRSTVTSEIILRVMFDYTQKVSILITFKLAVETVGLQQQVAANILTSATLLPRLPAFKEKDDKLEVSPPNVTKS